ncbi:MAG: hypothetical protein U0Q12_05385 [Vicinamibacterales bacterium]
MELLRRALLVGCVLPALWLLRLAPLDPLLTFAPHDFAAQQAREAGAVSDDQKTEDERRRAQIPLPVYIEEFLQYNVYPASGPAWDAVLRDVDAATGTQPTGDLASRVAPGADASAATHSVYFRPDESPVSDVLDQLAAGRGTTYVSVSRPGGDRHYRVDRRSWTRRDFSLTRGFTGTPEPPNALLYPFRSLGLGLGVLGFVVFALLPSTTRDGSWLGLSWRDVMALGAAIVGFAAPLAAVGGSVQALTRGASVLVPCWLVAALAVHLFAGPTRHAPEAGLLDSPGGALQVRAHPSARFVREGLAFLAMALGPIAFLVLASMTLWNR